MTLLLLPLLLQVLRFSRSLSSSSQQLSIPPNRSPPDVPHNNMDLTLRDSQRWHMEASMGVVRDHGGSLLKIL